MLELKSDRLVYSFPDVHPDASCTIEFQRTLRIPDDGKTYPLPPGLGLFPVRKVEDFKENLSTETLERGGVMLPMYQSEALWIKFSSRYVTNQGAYPFAVRVGAGKRSAVTANEWIAYLKDGDYVVIPTQPWIDGFVVSEGKIKQFVAAPLGMGFTVEEQLTQKAEFGGIQLQVYPMKREEFDKRFPVRRAPPATLSMNNSWSGSAGRPGMRLLRATAKGPSSMGMAAGGSMRQQIYKDPYGLDVWDRDQSTRTFIHLMNSLAWKQITGNDPPHAPLTAKDYDRRNLPWFDYYSDAASVGATSDTAKIKSVAEMADEKGFTILPENESTEPKKVVAIPAPPNPNQVKDGNW